MVFLSYIDIEVFKDPKTYDPEQRIDSQPHDRLTWLGRWIDRGHQDKIFFKRVLDVYKERLGIESTPVLEQAWRQARQLRLIQWDASLPLTVETFEQIEQALKVTLLFHGNGVQPQRGDEVYPLIGTLLDNLLGKTVLNDSSIGFDHFKAIFLKKDPALLQQFRSGLASVLTACSRLPPPKDAKEELLLQAFVGHLVALLPYTYPEEGEAFSIPQKIEGTWKPVTYKIDRVIELTPRAFATPILAYGLTSTEEGAPPLLSFIGTTFPAGDGFLATLLSDFTPGFSVGHLAAWWGAEEIGRWLQDKQGAQLYGTSLGGALAFHALRYHKEHIGQIHAYNPPGLYPWNWSQTYEGEDPKVHIYYQENDLVPTMGFFPEGENVQVYRIHAEKAERGVRAHAVVYTGKEKVTILKSSPEHENGRLDRKFLTVLHILLGGVILFLPVLILYLLFRLFHLLAIPVLLIKK